MSKYIKWIAGGLGWAFMGPIGGLLGFVFGSMFDNIPHDERNNNQTNQGDFYISLLILSAAVIKADKKIHNNELDFVKSYFTRMFGNQKAEQFMQMLSQILQHDVSVQDVCLQIKQYMEYESRLQLLHFLYGIAAADHDIDPREIDIIKYISNLLGISEDDYVSIKAMFIKDQFGPYKILEINPDASNEEVKKAFRLMAIKYHPDKVSHLGEDIQHSAKIKFQQLNEAYEKIKKQRGLK